MMSGRNTAPTSVLLERYQGHERLPEFQVVRLESKDHQPLYEATVEVVEGAGGQGGGHVQEAGT